MLLLLPTPALASQISLDVRPRGYPDRRVRLLRDPRSKKIRTANNAIDIYLISCLD